MSLPEIEHEGDGRLHRTCQLLHHGGARAEWASHHNAAVHLHEHQHEAVTAVWEVTKGLPDEGDLFTVTLGI